jgi:hypothetical protein
MYGEAGDDELYAEGDKNTLDGGDGSDFMTAYGGENYLEGGAGDDDMFAEGTVNIMNGGAGDDFMQGIGKNIMNGGTGNDIMVGADEDDVFYTGTGSYDRTIGNGGYDKTYVHWNNYTDWKYFDTEFVGWMGMPYDYLTENMSFGFVSYRQEPPLDHMTLEAIEYFYAGYGKFNLSGIADKGYLMDSVRKAVIGIYIPAELVGAKFEVRQWVENKQTWDSLEWAVYDLGNGTAYVQFFTTHSGVFEIEMK